MRSIKALPFLVMILFAGSAAAQTSGTTTRESRSPTPSFSKGLQFCNESGVTDIYVAISYLDGRRWVQEGWWQVRKGDCVIALGTLEHSHAFYYAYDGRHTVGETSNGPALCVRPGIRFIYRSGHCPPDAEKRPFERVEFNGDPVHRVSFIKKTEHQGQ